MTNYENIKNMTKEELALLLTIHAKALLDLDDLKEEASLYREYLNFLSEEAGFTHDRP